jgi:hypothetical protein
MFDVGLLNAFGALADPNPPIPPNIALLGVPKKPDDVAACTFGAGLDGWVGGRSSEVFETFDSLLRRCSKGAVGIP